MEKPRAGGKLVAPDETRPSLKGRRFVFTYAQNNTYLHDDFWNALLHFKKKRKAQLIVSRGTYNKNGWAHHGGTTKKPSKEDVELWYDPRIKRYVVDEQVKVTDGLLFCGELDILPTAANPLSSLEEYPGPNSAIIPHAKVHLKSLATMKNEPTNFLYTTGACTLRNYIERKAGQIATFHHVFGALYVEIDDDGEWFARQLIADRNGVFYDIDTAYGPGWSCPAKDMGDTIVTLGDIHIEKIDPVLLQGTYNMLKVVQPKHIFIHDLIDFTTRNHHNIKDPHFLADQFFHGLNFVEEGMHAGARFLSGLSKNFPDTIIHVVPSNHDQAFERWLKWPDAQHDAPNAGYWHHNNAVKHAYIKAGKKKCIFTYAMMQQAAKHGLDLSRIDFILEDAGCVINGIQYGLHGHRGAHGAKGGPKAFRTLGKRVNKGHDHATSIFNGTWTGGLLGYNDQGYNAGLCGWSPSNIISYPSSKRAIYTQRGPKWRA